MSVVYAILGICGVFLIPNIILAIWTYLDAINRGIADKSGSKVAFWVVFVFVIPLLGILFYVIARPKGRIQTCANCRKKVLNTLSKCPHCDTTARSKPVYRPPPPVQAVPPPQRQAPPPQKKELKCPHCNGEIQEVWKSCPHCGKKLKVEKAIIDEVFLMYKDGRLIKHFTRRIKPDVDQDILGGMLTAVQDFVKDTFRGEEGELDQMKFGRFQILISHGRYITIAAVMIGEEFEPFRPQISKTIDDIEGDYEVMLRNWDGDIDQLKVLGRYVNDLIDGRYS